MKNAKGIFFDFKINLNAVVLIFNRVKNMTDYSNMTQNDYWHDFNVKAVGRERARNNNPNLSAAAACSDYRRKNRALPEKYR